MCVLAMTENNRRYSFPLGQTDNTPRSTIAAEKGRAGETPGVGVNGFLASPKEPISVNVR
jgi:hypothetical protein